MGLSLSANTFLLCEVNQCEPGTTEALGIHTMALTRISNSGTWCSTLSKTQRPHSVINLSDFTSCYQMLRDVTVSTFGLAIRAMRTIRNRRTSRIMPVWSDLPRSPRSTRSTRHPMDIQVLIETTPPFWPSAIRCARLGSFLVKSVSPTLQPQTTWTTKSNFSKN